MAERLCGAGDADVSNDDRKDNGNSNGNNDSKNKNHKNGNCNERKIGWNSKFGGRNDIQDNGNDNSNGNNNDFEFNTNSIYSSDHGVCDRRFMNGIHNLRNTGNSSLNCVAFGNGRYRNFGGGNDGNNGNNGSDIAVTTGIAHRNRFHLNHYNRANRSQLTASFSLFYNFQRNGNLDRFSFPPENPYYLPPVERCVSGRQVDFVCPLMDSGEETMINQTNIMSKGFKLCFRPGMTIKVSPLRLSLVLDSGFERKNITYAARDPIMDLLFSGYIYLIVYVQENIHLSIVHY